MSNYNLSLTGAQVNSALNKVHNADSQPTSGSQNMITSDAVNTAVANLVSDSVIVNNLLSPSSTTIPTTSAVADALTSPSKVGVNLSNFDNSYQAVSNLNEDNFFKSTDGFGTNGFTSYVNNISESSSGSGEWTINEAGFYIISARFETEDTSFTSHKIEIQVNGQVLDQVYHPQNNSGAAWSLTSTFPCVSSDAIRIRQTRTYGAGGYFKYKNAKLDIIKLV